MGDVVGRLFREFAITLAVTIVISAVVSLTLTPTLSAPLAAAPTTEARRAAFGTRAQALIDDVIDRYDVALDWVLDRQTATLIVAAGDAGADRHPLPGDPQGPVPHPGHRPLQGVTEAGQSISYARMADLQQQVAAALLKDPDVASLTSYIGVDGTNTTLNTGRMLINLVPLGQRTVIAGRRSSSACASAPTHVAGMTLYLQPVQDLTIDSNVGPHPVPVRAARAPTRRPSTPGPAKLVAAARATSRRCATSPPTCRARACRPSSPSTATPPRGWAITPATVDDALYDAFGQRIISTIFTESNQYRVILEADPTHDQHARRRLASLYMTAASGAPTPLSALSPRSRPRPRRCRSTTWPSSRPPTSPSTPRRASRWATAVNAIEKDEKRHRRARRRSPPPSWAPPTPTRPRSATSCG